jgi:tetrahydromethanopterin S-methyltransferase subunit B
MIGRQPPPAAWPSRSTNDLDMESITNILTYGALLSLLAFSLLAIGVYVNPRIFLHTCPQDVRDKVSPITQAERRLSWIFQIPFLMLVLTVPFLSTWRQNAGQISFVALFLNASGVVFVFNLVDLLLDCILDCRTPKFLTLPGTEGMAGYRNYARHFRGFLVGTVASVAFGLVIAAVVTGVALAP